MSGQPALLSQDEVKSCVHEWAEAFHDGVPAMDMIITWWADKSQSNRRMPGSWADKFQSNRRMPGSFLQHTRVENQREITYMLRSLQDKGLMDYIRDVYVLIDKDVLSNFGAPACLHYDEPVVLERADGKKSTHTLRIVSDDVTGSSEAPYEWPRYNKRLQGLHRIPGLSEFFLLMLDDGLLLKSFADPADVVGTFFEGPDTSSPLATTFGHEVARAGTPVMYTYGSVSNGDCLGRAPVGAGHGPVLGSKSVWAALDKSLFTAHPSENPLSYEAICVYQHTMRDAFGALEVGYGGRVHGKDANFFRECHTNGGCTSPEQIGDSVFLNLQGNGISDEYGSVESSDWSKWYHQNFGKPSLFEAP